MINGRFDFIFPLETSARPMLRLLGPPEKGKRLVVQDTGHLPPTHQTAIKETLDWFDHYLGPAGKE
jgi:hypothetical protein